MTLAKVGILSIGDMGLGIANLLVAHGFPVSTNVAGRSQDTVDRAKAARIEILETDKDLARHCDIILSVVPPRDALATARRIADALPAQRTGLPLYYADMNAVAPATCTSIANVFAGTDVRLVDGCILGGPPKAKNESKEWYRPLMPTSGPHSLDVFPSLAETLNSRHLGDRLGSASGLKMCFAALSKGYAAIAIQSFTTAHRLGVLADLQWALAELVPGRVAQTEAALTGMPPKAYRWVREMEEISATFADDGGFGPELFAGAAGVFAAVAADPVLGAEKVGKRKRGQTGEDVAAALAEGFEAKEAEAEAKTKKAKTDETTD